MIKTYYSEIINFSKYESLDKYLIENDFVPINKKRYKNSFVRNSIDPKNNRHWINRKKGLKIRLYNDKFNLQIQSSNFLLDSIDTNLVIKKS